MSTHKDNLGLNLSLELEKKQQKDFLIAEGLVPITKASDTKEENEKYAIFYSGADTQHWDSVSGSGDTDYIAALAAGMNQMLQGSACHLHNIHSEKEIYAFIEKHKRNATPILHVLRNAPRIGSAFSTEGLEAFKKTGGKIIVTAVEYYKHRWSRDGQKLMQDLLNCMQVADDVIFLDEMDKKAALDSLPLLMPGNTALKAKIENAKVICVPPTVTVSLPKDTKRGTDIISFGMIRTGKGLAHVRKLAGLIKHSKDPLIKDKKIIVVGSVMLDPAPSAATLGSRENFARNQELYKLMYCIYPSKRLDMITAIKGNTSDNKTLKELLKVYQAEERAGNLKPALPIELQVDVPEEALAPLFARAKYSFLPPYRGATLRNTSISCSLSQAETGLVTLSHQDTITPPELSEGGKYAKAMVLMQGEEYGTGNDDDLSYQADGYAGAIYEEIIRRETEPKLNEETLAVAKSLIEERLSRNIVSLQHRTVYESVLSHSLIAARIDAAGAALAKGVAILEASFDSVSGAAFDTAYLQVQKKGSAKCLGDTETDKSKNVPATVEATGASVILASEALGTVPLPEGVAEQAKNKRVVAS